MPSNTPGPAPVSSTPRPAQFIENRTLVMVLPCVAGIINATGFFVVGVYTSHTTGHVARVGDELAQQHWHLAFQAASWVIAFLLGAMLATAMVEGSLQHHRAKYARAILVESVLLAWFVAANTFPLQRKILGSTGMTAMLCTAMGMQNALVTKLSGAVVRTTHLTGIVTDIGIESVRLAYWFREQTRGQSLVDALRSIYILRTHRELKKIRLHVAIFGSFLFGATVGPFAYLSFGAMAMAVPSAALVLLAVFDTQFGLTKRKTWAS